LPSEAISSKIIFMLVCCTKVLKRKNSDHPWNRCGINLKLWNKIYIQCLSRKLSQFFLISASCSFSGRILNCIEVNLYNCQPKRGLSGVKNNIAKADKKNTVIASSCNTKALSAGLKNKGRR